MTNYKSSLTYVVKRQQKTCSTSLPSPSHPKLLRRTLHQLERALRAGQRLAHSELARLERAFLACIREVLQLYYINLVTHSGGRIYLLQLILFFHRRDQDRWPCLFFYYWLYWGTPESNSCTSGDE